MKLLSLLCALFISINVFAQMPPAAATKGRISGVVIDSLTKKPVEYASVALTIAGAAKSVNGALTDAKGAFVMDNVVPGKYKVSVSFMGYKQKEVNDVVTTGAKPDKNLGRVILAPSSNLLKEVAVTGEVPMVENRVDKVVYNAEKDATVSGGNAGDVLRKVPMLSVDQDGNVSLRGSQNVRILINGKPSGAVAASTADAMRMLPADQIKNVEVITSPSAKYDAEGTGGIINIITKKREISGVSGSVSGGVGTRQNNGNANLNINKNRLSITANLGGNGSWPQTTRTMNNSFAPVLGTRSIQQGESNTKRFGVMGSGNVSYDFNDYNSLSTGIRVNRGQFKTDGSSFNSRTFLREDVMQSEEYSFDNLNKTTFSGFDWNADYTHKFKTQGHELSLAGQWSHSKNETDFSSLYSILTRADQMGNNDASNDEYTVQLDYSLPLNKVFKLELGGKTITREITSNSLFNTAVNGGAFEYNPLLSNIYDYNQDVLSGYSVLSIQASKSVGIQVGGRLERTEIEGQSAAGSSEQLAVSNDYTNFIPSFAISKTFKNFQTLRLSYSKRIQRPSLQYLNPFRDISNDQFQRQGNPALSPEVSQTVELGFSKMIKTSMINTSVYFRHTADIIESITRPDQYEGRSVTLTSYDNIGTNNSVGASFFGSVSPVKGTTIRGNFDIYSYKPSTGMSFSDLAGESKTYALYKAYISGSVTLPKDLIAETFYILNSPRRTFQGESPSFSMWQVSFSKQILNKKAKIGLNVIDPFNETKHFKSNINSPELVQVQDFGIPFRSVGINFSYTFGKTNFNPQPRKKRGVSNDDLKQDGGQTGQGGMTN
ncbi:MAG: TonB-dependent receptor domain-containing protein [Arcticibacter sp.]